MDEQFDALRKAFGEAGIEVPDDPTALPLEALDEQVTDRRLRGACKSALVKFKRAAEASGWSPAGSEAPPESDAELVEAPEAMVESTVAEPTPSADQPKRPTITEPVATAAAPVTADAAPMSPELSARYEAMEAAFAAAAAPLPDDPLTFDLNSLDSMDDDKKQRGQVKSALMKFVKLAKDEGWAAAVAPAAAVSEPVLPPPQAAMEPPAEEPTPSAAGLGESVDPATLPGAPPMVEPAAAPEPMPMSPELAERFAAVRAAFETAGAEMPVDPVGFDLNTLDERIEDKKLRGQAKSALAKFRRLAGEEGWQATLAVGATPAAAPIAAAPAAAQAAKSATAEPVPSAGAMAVPSTSPSDLWLLGPQGWVKLGTATRQPTPADELVGQKTASGATQRITNILILDGQFSVPEDLYNTFCYLAHEDVVYKAYYISHVGDVKRGTKTASLKVDETFDTAEFARAYEALARNDRPTADDARLHRFGKRYRAERGMFVEQRARLI